MFQADNDLEELVEFNLMGPIVIKFVHQLDHFVHSVDQSQANQWHTELVRTDRPRAIIVQTLKALLQLDYLIILELHHVGLPPIFHPRAPVMLPTAQNLGRHGFLLLLAPRNCLLS